MIVHMVLYQPRPDLSSDDRQRFNAALTNALASIPTIRRARVGRRVRHGAAYEGVMPTDFEYVGLLEFDDLAGLRSYLDHPAHAELGTLFYTCNAAALAYDYDVPGTDPIATIAEWV
jgi:stress responsive alpha/beta barrel protein